MHKMVLQLTGDKYVKAVHSEDIMDFCLLAALSIFFPMKPDDDATVFHVPDSVGNLIFGLKAPMAGRVVLQGHWEDGESAQDGGFGSFNGR